MHILDQDALRMVTPASLAAFARTQGWSRAEPYGQHADVYTGENRPEIILPRTEHLGDYPAVVGRLIRVFADVSSQDEVTTYRDLVGSGYDTIRVRVSRGDDDGTIDVDAGVLLVTNARDMLLAAACAARSSQPYYRAGANREAADYMRRVKLGQTERGSFIVTLLAPVPPLLQGQLSLEPSWAPLEEEPLERLVTRRLMDGLAGCREAAEAVLAGDGAAFDRSVARGVSANLCEAVAGLSEQSARVDVNLTWARTRPAPMVAQRVTFSSTDAQILAEAARTFRLKQPRDDVRLLGAIVNLKRSPAERVGHVTVKAMIDDSPQSVVADLDEDAYAAASQAHTNRRPVVISGDLRRVGQRWQLVSPTLTEVPPDDDSEDDASEIAPPPA